MSQKYCFSVIYCIHCMLYRILCPAPVKYCTSIFFYNFLKIAGGWRGKTWLISCSGKSCSACSSLLTRQRIHVWILPQLWEILNHLDKGILQRLQFWEEIGIISVKTDFSLNCVSLESAGSFQLILKLLGRWIGSTDWRYLKVHD